MMVLKDLPNRHGWFSGETAGRLGEAIHIATGTDALVGLPTARRRALTPANAFAGTSRADGSNSPTHSCPDNTIFITGGSTEIRLF